MPLFRIQWEAAGRQGTAFVRARNIEDARAAFPRLPGVRIVDISPDDGAASAIPVQDPMNPPPLNDQAQTEDL